MKSLILSLLALPLLSLAGIGQTRQFNCSWPQPQPTASEPLACLPVPAIGWLGTFESNIDQFNATPADLIFDGDSITAGWLQAGQPGPLNEWQQRYGVLNAVDIGIGGDQVQNLIWRVQNGSLAGQNPKLIVVLIGTNNIGQNASDVATGIRTLIGAYETQCPYSHILLQGIFPRGNSATDPSRPWISQVNALLAASYANGEDPRVSYIDFGSQFLEPDGSISTSMMADGLHPSYPGYVIWANAIESFVDQYVTGTSSYALTVNSGSGSGSYPAGTTVTVTANAATGPAFAGWAGNTANLAAPTAATTTLVMPPAATSITATYPASAPASPSGLTAASCTAHATLNWTPVTAATSYNVFRGTASGAEIATALATGVATPSYTDTNVIGGTTYYYEVKAVNTLGVSGSSNEASATPQAEQTRQISLSWPQPVQPSTVPTAAFPVPRITWVTSFETNVDKLSAGPYELVFDGDSIMSSFDSNVWQQYYAALTALNIGVYGDQVQNVTWRVQNGDLTNQSPKLIVVLAGGNNYGQDAADVASGIQMLLSNYEKQCPTSHILLLGILPQGNSATNPARAWVTSVNQIISTYSNSQVSYLDIGSQLLQPDGSITTQMMPDGYNLGTQGYAILANAIQPAINQYVTGIWTAPAPPAGVSATAGNAQVSLSWTADLGAMTYNIFRGTSAGGENATPIATGVTTTTYTDTTVTNGTCYYYTVAAVNSSGTSTYSSEVSSTPSATATVAAPPVELMGVEFPQYYGGLCAPLNGSGSGTGGYTAGVIQQRYWNVANAFTNAGPGSGAGTVTNSNFVTYQDTSTGSTNLLDSTGSNSGVQFTVTNAVEGDWSSDYESFPVASTTAGGNADTDLARGVIFSSSTTPVTLALTSLNPNHTYNVIAYVGSPWWSGSVNIAVSLGGTTYYVNNDSKGILTTWTCSTATTAATAPIANYVEFTGILGSVLNSEVLTVKGVNSGLSGFQIADTGGAPQVPTGLWAAEGPTQVSLSWTASACATTYNIYRGTTSQGESTLPIATGVTTTSYTDTQLTNNITYYYKVAGVNSSGTSAYSNEANAEPVGINNLLTVTNGSGSGNYPMGTVVTVTANAPASGYQFAGWTGDTNLLALASAATTTLTMPNSAASITATYFSPANDLQIAVSGSTVTLTLQSSIVGCVYQLQSSTDLVNWQNVGSVQAGTGGNLIISTPRGTTVSQCFYRLKLN